MVDDKTQESRSICLRGARGLFGRETAFLKNSGGKFYHVPLQQVLFNGSFCSVYISFNVSSL